MKIASAAVALALTAVLSKAAHAQLAYSEGDLLLGFEQQNGSGGVTGSDYVVNLGSVSQFLNLSPGGSLQFSLSSSDLTSAFGSGWAANTGSQVQWGVFGAGDSNGNTLSLGGNTIAADTLFYTKGRTATGTQTTAPNRLNDSAQNQVNSNFVNLATDFSNETPSAGSSAGTASLLKSTIEASSGADSWSALAGIPASSSGAFGSGKNIEQASTGSNGPTDSVLDLYESVPTSSSNQKSLYLGDLSLGSTGVLTFNAVAAAVPEPSSYVLAAIAAVTFFVLRRRKAISAR